MTTQHTIEVLEDIFTTHGFPRLLVSDNRPQFTAEEFGSFLQSSNIVHHKSPPYHPATNGLAENNYGKKREIMVEEARKEYHEQDTS